VVTITSKRHNRESVNNKKPSCQVLNRCPGLRGYHQVSAFVETIASFVGGGKKTKIVFLKSLPAIIELNNQAELQTSDGSYKHINNWRKGS